MAQATATTAVSAAAFTRAAAPVRAPVVHTAVLDAALRPVATGSASAGAGLAAAPAHGSQARRQYRQRSEPAPLPATYTVRRGDSLSSIAGHLYHDRAAWPVLYWRNRSHVRWANDIYAGQVLHVPARPDRIPRAPAALAPPARLAAPAPAAAPAQAVSGGGVTAGAAYSGGFPGGSFGACVVARESGGDAQVMNASGHYGLYQFSESTWVEYGGSAADFGHASAAEQNQVFANALAAGGESNWAPYDGC